MFTRLLNWGDDSDIEFTDDSYIGTYTASAENVPQKYINIAEIRKIHKKIETFIKLKAK